MINRFQNSKLKIFYFIVCILLCVGTILFSFNNYSNQNFAFADTNAGNTYEKIDEYLYDVCKKAHFPSMSITIVDKDEILFSNTYGDCNSTETPFLLGSVSKSFTALCIMQLVEKGKINLDEYISAYIPSAKDGNKITVRQLLNHTSGLGEHQNLGNYKIIGKQGEHVYANVNYSILGRIIETVSGEKYEKFVSSNIFEPLSMTKSAASLEKAKENGLIEGYENWFGINILTNPKFPTSENEWITTAAGYLSSSTNDLGKYLQMYLNDGQGIISPNSIKKMFYENVPVEADIPYKYGMGWTLINEPLPHPALRHAGLVETGMSTIYILPEIDIAFAIAVNTNDYFVGKDFMDRIDWGVCLMLMGENPNEIKNGEYSLKHFLYNFAYLIVFIISILPICFITKIKKHFSDKAPWLKIIYLVFIHILLPVFLLLLPRIFFSTPMWVVCAFVPDIFLTLIVSSCLLFIGGAAISILWIINEIKRRKSPQDSEFNT